MIKIITTISLMCTICSCTHKSDLVQMLEKSLDEDQGFKIEITPQEEL